MALCQPLPGNFNFRVECICHIPEIRAPGACTPHPQCVQEELKQPRNNSTTEEGRHVLKRTASIKMACRADSATVALGTNTTTRWQRKRGRSRSLRWQGVGRCSRVSCARHIPGGCHARVLPCVEQH
mmetsp:Transcript_96757/g.312447  ORF Transcript_96757/g.312447 Transcript_96757/m.312447 type:complete len:127 (+) Transcript_96757:756-1136(+)